MTPSGGSRRVARDGDPMRRLLEYIEDVNDAVTLRDWPELTSLLRKRVAGQLPREIREELLALSRRSPSSFRAPMLFLQFQHRMTQVAAGGETLIAAQTEIAFERSSERGEARQSSAPLRAAASRPKTEKR